MALLWFDGFDTQNGVSGIYFSGNVSSVAGRYGGKGIQLNTGANSGYARVPIAMSGSSIYVGVALYVTSGATGVQKIMTFSDGTTLSVNMATAAFTLAGPSGIYSVSSPGNAAYLNTWNYVEVGITFETGATGAYAVHINGVVIPSLTGTGVATSGATSINSVELDGENYGATYFDDFYICDGSGSSSNTFLGNQKVNLYMPSAPGRITQFAQTGAASNWQAVDEIPPDGDTSYVGSSTVGNTDAYDLALIAGQTASTGVVTAVKVTADARIDDAGTRTLEIGVGNGTTEAYGSAIGLSGTYVSYPSLFIENPFTSALFTNSDLTTLEAAIKVAA